MKSRVAAGADRLSPASSTRRRFLRQAAGAGLSLTTLGTSGCAETTPPAPEPAVAGRVPSPGSRVVEVRSERCWRGDVVDEDALAEMLTVGLATLFGQRSAGPVWESLFSERDTVGLKVNCLAGPGLSTRPELARVVARALGAAGLGEDRVIAWDRTDEELARAGYDLNPSGRGLRCFGTDHAGVGNDRELTMNGKVGGFLSSLLTRHTTTTINLPVLKDHGIVGVSGSLKNNFGCIHNPNKYHPNLGDPYAADLNALPQIRQRQRLVVCDATTLQYQGGPGFKPQWAERYGALLVATDPVAHDRVCWSLLEQWRADNGLPSLEEVKRPAKHILTAGSPRYGLGEADLDKIEFVRQVV